MVPYPDTTLNRVISIGAFIESHVTAWVAEGGRIVLCYVQGSGRRKRKKGVGCGSGRQENYGSGRRDCGRIRTWDPKIKRVFQDNTLRTREGCELFGSKLKWIQYVLLTCGQGIHVRQIRPEERCGQQMEWREKEQKGLSDMHHLTSIQ
ncbi:hypothetical protein Tco_0126766 [Tanacetum coccineum]